MAESHPLRSRFAGRWLLSLSLFLAIIGAKFALNDRYGSELPFWDQWDAEGAYLFQPYLEGRLTAADVFSAHNEHRPVFTRVLALALLEAGDREWDARVQILVNALLHATVALLLFALAWRALPPVAAPAYAALIAWFFSSNVSWENTLVGFQSQFYFVLLFSALHLAGTLLAPPRSWLWWLAPLAGAAGVLSMASGLISALAIGAVIGARVSRDRTLNRNDIYILACNSALIVAGWLLKADVPGHDTLKVSGFVSWFDAWMHQLAWPVPMRWAAPLGLIPPLMLAVAFFRRRIDGPVALTLLGVSCWYILQTAAIAYARGGEGYGLASRYSDTLAAGVLINLLSLLYIARAGRMIRSRMASRVWTAGAIMFVAVALWGLSRESTANAETFLRDMPRVNEARIENVRSYVIRQDPAFFEKSPWDELPYPSAARLGQLLDVPALRKILPASVRPPVSIEPADGSHGFSPAPPSGGAAPLGLPAWSSSPGAAARFVSTPFRADHSRVTLHVAGGGDGAASLRLIDERGRAHEPLGGLVVASEWKRINFSVTDGATYRLEAAHEGAGWIAFTAPTTRSFLSVMAEKLVRVGAWLFGFSAILALAALFALEPVRALVLGAAGLTQVSSGRDREECRLPEPPLHPGRLHYARVTRSRERRRYFGTVVAVAFAIALTAVLLVCLGVMGGSAAPDRHSPAAETGTAVANFALTHPDASGESDARFVGAIFLLEGARGYWFGTYVGGDTFTGRIVSTEFPLDEDWLYLPIVGYPNSTGNRLSLEILDEANNRIGAIDYTGANPRELPGRWDINVRQWRGHQARLVVVDTETTSAGWLGVGTPVYGKPSGPGWLDGVPRNYLWFAISAVALAGLLFLPGLALRSGWGLFGSWSPALVPLPGLLLLALIGLVTWFGGTAGMKSPGHLWLGGHIVLAVLLAIRWWHGRGLLRRSETEAFAIYGCIAIGALAFAVLPLDVAQEFGNQTSSASRMIASPPDHDIPYRTASYFFQGKDGREDRVDYFGDEWSASSRGPIAPLAVTSAFVLFDADVNDPPSSHLDRWPATRDAFYLSRIVGILTNALVILGAATLASRLSGSTRRIALVAMAVAPVVAINIDFLWPKLLATFFVSLAVLSVVERRALHRTAGWIALSYLSHPVGGLFAPPIALWVAHHGWLSAIGGLGARIAPAIGRAVRLALWVIVWTSPWLLFKLWVAHPDLFLQYPLGDGRGFIHAESATTWLRSRIDNLIITLVPGAFQLSDYMRAWIAGPLSDSLRWALGYAKALPGALGYGFFAAAIVAMFRRPTSELLGFRRYLLLGSFALMLLFWGYSSDGLGRNCLEPLAILMIVFTAAALPPGWRGWRWLLLLTAFEALSVRAIGIIGASTFSPDVLDGESLALAGVALLAGIAPAWWFFSRGPGVSTIWPALGHAASPSPIATDSAARSALIHEQPASLRWQWLLLMIVVLGVLLVLRKPHALTTPQLWAEDGSVFLVENELLGWKAWFLPYAGYLHLFPRIVASVTSWMDPCLIPATYNTLSFLVWWLVAASLLSPRVILPGKFWLAAAVAVVPHTGEVLFQLCNVQWASALLLVRQLILRPAQTRTEKISDGIVLAIVGFTGPFSIVLWPAFAWRAWTMRDQRATRMELIIITAAAASHVIAGMIVPFSPPSSEGFDLVQIAAFAGQRTLGIMLFGWEHAAQLGLTAKLLLFAALLALFAFALRRTWHTPSGRAVAVFGAVIALILAPTLVRGGHGLWGHPVIQYADRYFFIPRVLLCWIFVLAVMPRGNARWLFVAVLAWPLWINRSHYVVPPPPDFQWHEHCHRLLEREPSLIPILPEGWIMEYPGKQRPPQ